MNRLGRHVEHDPRSRAFAMPEPSGALVSRAWRRHGDVFDQGKLGSCTANAACGVLMTEPFYRPSRVLGERECVELYKLATRLDRVPGHYPPTDTGSSGLGVAKAAKQVGYISGYRHAFSLDAALFALTRGPIIAGFNWWSGFDTPQGSAAQLVISGYVRGGHEVELSEIDVAHRVVRGKNSWGSTWGDRGGFSMSFETLARLLEEQGDAREFVE